MFKVIILLFLPVMCYGQIIIEGKGVYVTVERAGERYVVTNKTRTDTVYGKDVMRTVFNRIPEGSSWEMKEGDELLLRINYKDGMYHISNWGQVDIGLKSYVGACILVDNWFRYKYLNNGINVP